NCDRIACFARSLHDRSRSARQRWAHGLCRPSSSASSHTQATLKAQAKAWDYVGNVEPKLKLGPTYEMCVVRSFVLRSCVRRPELQLGHPATNLSPFSSATTIAAPARSVPPMPLRCGGHRVPRRI